MRRSRPNQAETRTRTRAFVVLFGLVFLPFAVLATAGYLLLEQRPVRAAEQRLKAEALSLAAEIDRDVADLLEAGRYSAMPSPTLQYYARRSNRWYRGRSRSSIERFHRSNAGIYRRRLLQSRPSLELSQLRAAGLLPDAELVLTDSVGRVLGATSDPADVLCGHEPWWLQAYGGGQGGTYLELVRTEGTCSVVVARPVYDSTGDTLRGVLRMTRHLPQLEERIRSAIVGKTGFALLVSGSGEELVEQDEPARLSNESRQQIAAAEALQYWGHGRDALDGALVAAVPVRSTTSAGQRRWVVAVVQDMSEFAPRRDTLAYGLAALLLVAGAAVAVGAAAIGSRKKRHRISGDIRGSASDQAYQASESGPEPELVQESIPLEESLPVQEPPAPQEPEPPVAPQPIPESQEEPTATLTPAPEPELEPRPESESPTEPAPVQEPQVQHEPPRLQDPERPVPLQSPSEPEEEPAAPEPERDEVQTSAPAPTSEAPPAEEAVDEAAQGVHPEVPPPVDENTESLKSDLIATIARELRAPLPPIVDLATLMMKSDLSEDSRRKFLAIIVEEGRRLMELIDKFSTLSMIESGKHELHLDEVDIREVVGRVVEAEARHHPRHQLSIEIPSDLPGVRADPERVSTAIRVLVSNAVMYSPAGGPVVVTGREEDGFVAVSVRDCGVGIRNQDMPMLFRRFERLNRDATPNARGFGLGLSICRGIVEQHGGRVKVDSVYGEGSTFTILLPVRGPADGRQVPLDI